MNSSRFDLFAAGVGPDGHPVVIVSEQEGETIRILDSYETEAASRVTHDSSRTFRPNYLAREVSLWPVILLALLVLAGWLIGSIYYLTPSAGFWRRLVILVAGH